MWKVTIKGLLAHKLRLALTALAIVLGVTFIAGTFVLTDTLKNTFTTLFGNIYQHVDFQVRGVAAFASNSGGGGAVRKPIPETILPTIRQVPGVAVAEGTVGGYAQYVGHDGKAVTTGGAPTIGLSWDPNQQLSALHIAQGAAADDGPRRRDGRRHGPEAPLRRRDNRCGSCSPGRRRRSPSPGIARFGTANNLAGATLAAFTLPTAQRCSARSAASTPSTWSPRPARTRPSVAARHRQGAAPRGGGGDRSDRRRRADERDHQGAGVLLDGAARVRLHRPVRRRVHDLQHLLDHRRPADAGARPAADRGGEPPPGVPLRAGRGRHRRVGGVAGRGGPGRAGRRRARGAAQRVRGDPAIGVARVRGPHRDRGADRRRRA